MTKQEIAKILNAAYATFPHITLTPHAIAQWFALFEQEEAGKFQAALNQAILSEESKFFPVPSQVAKVLKLMAAPVSCLETAVEAWESAWKGKAVSKKTRRVLELMPGWEQRGQWQTEHMPFRRKEFIEIYTQLEEKESSRLKRDIALTASERKVLQIAGLK
jgi:hypothetical protein